jgi:hypothetical protein
MNVVFCYEKQCSVLEEDFISLSIMIQSPRLNCAVLGRAFIVPEFYQMSGHWVQGERDERQPEVNNPKNLKENGFNMENTVSG